MKFYNRKKELDVLHQAKRLSTVTGGQMILLTGRRRFGKSELLKQYRKQDENTLYFFVSKKRSSSLLTEFTEILSEYSGLQFGFDSWDKFIHNLFQYSIKNETTLIFDEFQNFQYLKGEGIFGTFQKYWDRYHDEKGLNLVFAGSVTSLLRKIFHDRKEPLYGRITKKIRLQQFDPSVIYRILCDKIGKVGIDTLLEYLTIFGGNPYYYSLMANADSFGKNICEIADDLVLREGAILQDEGYELLILEFGGDHLSYFSILEAIAIGKNTFSEISDWTRIGRGMLSRNIKELYSKFDLIKKKYPIALGKQRNPRYVLDDQFLKFWLKYVYRNQTMIEEGRMDIIKKKVRSELRSLMGVPFEKLCASMFLDLSAAGKTNFLADDFGRW